MFASLGNKLSIFPAVLILPCLWVLISLLLHDVGGNAKDDIPIMKLNCIPLVSDCEASPGRPSKGSYSSSSLSWEWGFSWGADDMGRNRSADGFIMDGWLE